MRNERRREYERERGERERERGREGERERAWRMLSHDEDLISTRYAFGPSVCSRQSHMRIS